MVNSEMIVRWSDLIRSNETSLILATEQPLPVLEEEGKNTTEVTWKFHYIFIPPTVSDRSDHKEKYAQINKFGYQKYFEHPLVAPLE